MTVLAAVAGGLVASGLLAARRRSQARQLLDQRLGRGAGTVAAATPRRGLPAVVDAGGTGSLPEVVDLLSVAVAAGLPVPAALAAVAPRVAEPWRSALTRSLDDASSGELLVAVLDRLPSLVGDDARPLVGVLRAGLVDGDGLAAGLARLSHDARDRRRRLAEEQARRIPVRLLLPLVACSLPAFAALTIVPILAGALRGLRFPT